MRRHRKLVVFTVLAITAVIATQQAWAADGDPQPTNPTGFGDLLPTPDLTNGDTRTLFENYGPMSYGLDYETGLRETFKAVFNGIANLLMMYVVAIVRGAISVGWWLFSFTDSPRRWSAGCFRRRWRSVRSWPMCSDDRREVPSVR